MSQRAIERQSAASLAPPKITYKEFLERYDGIRAEWVDGKVELMSPVFHVHQRIGHFLFRILSEVVEAYHLGEVFQLEFQMKLNKERAGREPDLFFVPKSRLQFVRPGFFDGPGDLVIEIVSPDSISSDTASQLLSKGSLWSFPKGSIQCRRNLSFCRIARLLAA